MFFHMNAWCRHRFSGVKELSIFFKSKWPAAEALFYTSANFTDPRAPPAPSKLAKWLIQSMPTIEDGIQEASDKFGANLAAMDVAWWILRQQGMPELPLNQELQGLLQDAFKASQEAPPVVKTWESVIYRRPEESEQGAKVPQGRSIPLGKRFKRVFVLADDFDTYVERQKARLPSWRYYTKLPPGPELF